MKINGADAQNESLRGAPARCLRSVARRPGAESLRALRAKYQQADIPVAELILGDIIRYGGEEAGLVRWARAVIESARRCPQHGIPVTAAERPKSPPVSDFREAPPTIRHTHRFSDGGDR